MNEPQKARVVTELQLPRHGSGTAKALVDGVWHILWIRSHDPAEIRLAFERGDSEPWPGEEITIDEAASDRALDAVAEWNAARPQAEKDAELARLREIARRA